MIFLFFVFICIYSGSAATEIKCIVVNLEYVNCSWDGGGIPNENFTFRSRYNDEKQSVECPSYQQVRGVRVSCVVSYSELKTQRFETLLAYLYRNNGSMVAEHKRKLIKWVKLNPPSNLAVNKHGSELVVKWTSSNQTKTICQDRQIRYRINKKDWKVQDVTIEDLFTLSFPNAHYQYDFQVRLRMSSTCGKSELWSDWSESVCWGSMSPSNDTEPESGTFNVLMVLYTCGAVVLLFILTYLLISSERLRLILIPVVPRPKNLGDLLNSYDGNVEKSLCIPKELQDGFKPNFSERPCAVREVRSQSESEESYLTSLSSDYQPMLSYSYASSPSSTSSLLLSNDESGDLGNPHSV